MLHRQNARAGLHTQILCIPTSCSDVPEESLYSLFKCHLKLRDKLISHYTSLPFCSVLYPLKTMRTLSFRLSIMCFLPTLCASQWVISTHTIPSASVSCPCQCCDVCFLPTTEDLLPTPGPSALTLQPSQNRRVLATQPFNECRVLFPFFAFLLSLQNWA